MFMIKAFKLLIMITIIGKKIILKMITMALMLKSVPETMIYCR